LGFPTGWSFTTHKDCLLPRQPHASTPLEAERRGVPKHGKKQCRATAVIESDAMMGTRPPIIAGEKLQDEPAAAGTETCYQGSRHGHHSKSRRGNRHSLNQSRPPGEENKDTRSSSTTSPPRPAGKKMHTCHPPPILPPSPPRPAEDGTVASPHSKETRS
jgi:hypothetical protein